MCHGSIVGLAKEASFKFPAPVPYVTLLKTSIFLSFAAILHGSVVLF